MPDNENVEAAGAGKDAGEEGKPEAGQDTDKKPETGAEKENDGAGGGGGDNQPEKKEGKDDAKAPEGSQKEDDKVDDGKEPEVRPRLSTQDFIIGRQHKKLSKAAEAGKKEGEGKDKNGSDGEGDDEIDPDDVKIVTKVIEPMIAPLIEKSLATEDSDEVQNFIKDNPDFKPFEAKVRRFMKHPSRRQLPIKSIFYEVAGDELIKIGAARQKAADAKADNTQTGGGSNRSGEGAKSVLELSTEEFQEKQEKIRQGQK